MRLWNFIIVSCALASASYSQDSTAEAEYTAGLAVGAKGDEIAALAYLKRAATLDPKMTKAYIAIGSIAELWCGSSDGADAPCEMAIDAYQELVALEPWRENAWKRLAYASYEMDRIDQAEIDYRRALSLDARDPEVLGGLAALDMRATHRNVVQAKADHNVVTGRELIGSPFCGQIREANLARVNEGIAFGTRALVVKNKNGNLMSFLVGRSFSVAILRAPMAT